MFHIGQEVECLGVEWDKVDSLCRPGGYWCFNWPEKGRRYTVRSVVVYGGHECLLLAEVVNPVRKYHGGVVGEPVFVSRWFAPIRKTDISIFTAMLRPVKEDA